MEWYFRINDMLLAMYACFYAIILDSAYVISKCVMLTNEMLAIAQHLCFYGNPARCPSLDTIENLAKLLPMIVQALWPKNSPLLQLPHITEQNLHYFRRVSMFPIEIVLVSRNFSCFLL